jgi:hypothetical protein
MGVTTALLRAEEYAQPPKEDAMYTELPGFRVLIYRFFDGI